MLFVVKLCHIQTLKSVLRTLESVCNESTSLSVSVDFLRTAPSSNLTVADTQQVVQSRSVLDLSVSVQVDLMCLCTCILVP